jgi:hypothetical protein
MSLALILLLVSANAVVCYADKLQGWTEFQGRYYGFGKTKVTWSNAETICSLFNGRLAEVSTPAENEFFKEIARNESVNGCLWLGASDIFHEGMWEWSSRARGFNSFQDWASKQPDNYNGAEDCLQLSTVEYKWNDGACSGTCSFLCVGSPTDSEETYEIKESETEEVSQQTEVSEQPTQTESIQVIRYTEGPIASVEHGEPDVVQREPQLGVIPVSLG